MNCVQENLHTEIIGAYDVLVAGGGVAGISAALSAARTGAKVLLVEKQYMLGGLGTAGLVTIYLPLCDGMGHQVSFGIAEELLRLSIRYGAEGNDPAPWLENGSFEEKMKTRFLAQYNPQLFAILTEQLLRSEGVKILYGASVCAVTTQEHRIKQVIFENKSGRQAVSVQSVVDATGDADICAMAGEDTVLFGQKNILAAWYYYLGKDGYGLKQLGASDIPDAEKGNGEEPVKLLSNRRFQGIDGQELSEMVQMAHNCVLEDIQKYRKTDKTYMPVTIATSPQVRMTRRVRGVHTLTEGNACDRVPDSIGVIGNWKRRGPSYQIPFRALYGVRIRNLITAGRCISVDDTMWDVTRVIPACAVTGEAAGLAAGISSDFSKLDINLLQDRLKKQGVWLG